MNLSSHISAFWRIAPFFGFDGENEMMDHHPAEGDKTVVVQ